MAIGTDPEKNYVKHRNSASILWGNSANRFIGFGHCVFRSNFAFQTVNFVWRDLHRAKEIFFRKAKITFGIVGRKASFVGPKKFHISESNARFLCCSDNLREKCLRNSPP